MRTRTRLAAPLTTDDIMAIEDAWRPEGVNPLGPAWGALPYPLAPFMVMLGAALTACPAPGRPVLCDLGAGPGGKVLAAQQAGCDAWGVEADPALAAVARSYGADVRDGRAEDADLAGTDIVWCAGLYRDTAPARRFETALWGRIRPGGLLMIASTPFPSGPPGWDTIYADPAWWRGVWAKPA
jgi:hypothetical protein